MRSDGEPRRDVSTATTATRPHPPRPAASTASRRSRCAGCSRRRRRGCLHAIRRVVDVGAGKGHLTAGFAALVGAPALAVEATPRCSASARALPVGRILVRGRRRCGEPRGAAPRRRPRRWAPPCGALGEALVAACAAHGGVHCLFVPCCHHKQGVAARAPLSRAARAAAAAARGGRAEEGVDGSGRLAVGGVAADARALRSLRRGVIEAALAGGAEMNGIQPRKAARGLEASRPRRSRGAGWRRRRRPPSSPTPTRRAPPISRRCGGSRCSRASSASCSS